MNYVYLVPLFPLIGFLINGLIALSQKSALDERSPVKGLVSWIGCTSVGLSFLTSIVIFFQLSALPAGERVVQKIAFPWILSGKFHIDIGFLLDPLSSVMILVVSGVGFFIHLYSIGYMAEDRGYARYFSFMNLFTFFMLMLVLSNNFLLLYLGWEGVGLCSYLLIGFWYEKKSAADAGKKAFIVNRIGDFGFALGVMLIFWTFGSLNFTNVFENAPHVLALGGGLVTAMTLLLFMGAIGKSAQIPLYVWLPDAMEGPTPVSALIHAATMVTAGVYMVARCHALFLLAPISMGVVAVIGAATAIYAASIGLVQNDIKRVLAYSTISQLGYMFLACGVGAFAAGIFHLMTHAFFKALLFLSAGSVIHALSGELNIQKMGGVKKYIPITFWCFLAGTLAISGIPLFSGFFSKDEILWKAFSSPHGHFLLWLVGVITAGLTAFYMFRLVFLTFLGKSRVDPQVQAHIHEAPKSMTFPLIILAVLSIIGGYVGIPHSLGGLNRFEGFLSPVFESDPSHTHLATHAMSTEYLLMIISIVIVIIGILVAYRFYIQNLNIPKRLAEKYRFPYRVLFNKYYVDELYAKVVVNPLLSLALVLWRQFDVLVIDGIANGIASMVKGLGVVIRKTQTGYLRNYALSLVFGAMLILVYYIFR
ncbi:MAG: NADH-quinone oxidoreductase subunit L [candidate division Zixibacteria bacterium]|nr:NADH-quinone oxidoreductase subunit L [candidate division Zixibacteria bacterium]